MVDFVFRRGLDIKILSNFISNGKIQFLQNICILRLNLHLYTKFPVTLTKVFRIKTFQSNTKSSNINIPVL